MRKKYKFECWNVAYRKHSADIERNKSAFRIIPNPFLYWVADPFVFKRGNKYYIFAELYNRITYKGQIGYCVLSDDLKHVSRWRMAIKADVHLSFPFIFEKEKNIYIMPESCRAHDLRIYKCTRFPYKWEIDRTVLKNVVMADSIVLDAQTIVSYDNIDRPRKLLLFKKTDKGWENTDCVEDSEMRLRLAGKMFTEKGANYLPLQDSSEDMYGRNVSVYKIQCFKDIGKGENFSYQISPEGLVFKGLPYNPCGIHTFNFDGECEVIDVKTYTDNKLSLVGYIFKRIREVIGDQEGQ